MVYYKRVNSQLAKWVKIFSVHVSGKRLLYNLYNAYKSIWKRGNLVDKRVKYLNRNFIKEVIQMASRHMKISSSSLGNRFQFQSVAQLGLTLCDPMDCSVPGFPVHHQLLELTQTHVHRVGDAIQPSHPLLLPSPPAFNLSQHQGLFQWVSSSHQVATVLEFQHQHQSLQWMFRTDFL